MAFQNRRDYLARMLTRRAFLRESTVSIGALSVLQVPAACASPSGLRLPIPPLLPPASTSGRFALAAQSGTTEFGAGIASRTSGFNGGFLGPTLLLRNGRTTAASVTNRLAESTTVHWHGLLIPAEADGGPHHLIEPGATWRTALDVRQPNATLWYHAHPHPRTGSQVYSGLAGMIIVSDGGDADLGLPHLYGRDDIPLLLRDAVLDRGRLVYPQHPMSRMMGVRGATILANGVPGPTAAVPRGLARLRLVNAANARVFHLSMSDQREMLWIASDGGFLDAPVPLRSLILAPGQRAELLVDFSSGSAAELVTGPDPTAGARMGMMRMADPLEGVASVVRFAPTGERFAANPPTRLPAQAAADPGAVTRRRKLTLTMGMGMGMMGGRMGPGRGGMGPGGGGGMGMMGAFGIDGRPFEMERVDHHVRLGDTELWEVSGDMMPHPFHMHGVHFHVLSRGGRAPDAADRGPKDTVLVREPVELLVRFTRPAERIPFMFHCHTLEHEDAGMMGQFKTI